MALIEKGDWDEVSKCIGGSEVFDECGAEGEPGRIGDDRTGASNLAALSGVALCTQDARAAGCFAAGTLEPAQGCSERLSDAEDAA